jgi:hypothetical protein
MPPIAPLTPRTLGISVVAHVLLIAWVAAVLGAGRGDECLPNPLSRDLLAQRGPSLIPATRTPIVIHTTSTEQRL